MKQIKKITAIAVALAIIVSVLCGMNLMAEAAEDVSSLLSNKKVLTPGSFDDLSTDDYAVRFIRSEAGYEGFSSVDDYFQVRENLITEADRYGYSETFGSMLKNPHKKAYFAVDENHSGAGASVIYKVVGGSYVASALVFQGSDISQAARMEVCNAYGFDWSSDGETWTAIEPDFTYEHGWTAQTPGPGHQISCVRAVVLLPDEAKYYRVTLPGFDKSKASNKSTDPDLHCNYNVPAQNDSWTGIGSTCGIGATCASEMDLNELNAWADVPTEANRAELEEFTSIMDAKKVLAPGTLDDLSDESYLYKMVRSKEHPAVDGVTLTTEDLVRKITAPAYDPNGQGTLVLMTQPLGHLFNKRVDRVLTNSRDADAWSGNAVIYKVVESTYVATMLAVPPQYNDWGSLPGHYSNFGFEVSVNGLYWQTVTPTFNNAGNWTAGKHQLSFTQATVQIPAGMSYYRITLPGYDKSATGTSLYVNNSWSPNSGGVSCGTTGVSIGAIGYSFASSYDLTQYSDFNDIPAETVDRSELTALLTRVSIVEEDQLLDGKAKNNFIAALETANAVNSNENAAQSEINKAVSKLTKAFVSLAYKEIDEAVLSGVDKQWDERRFLRPGIYDEMLASPMLNDDKTVMSSEGLIVYRSDYSDPFILSTLDGVNNTAYTRMLLGRSNIEYSALTFMGKPVKGAYTALSSWAGSGIQYRVYGNSYVATALIVRKNVSDPSLGDLSQQFAYMISKDGVNWTEISPESIVQVDSCTQTSDGSVPASYNLYKATVKIPEGYTYYRIFSPGALELTDKTGYYTPNPSPSDAHIGPSIASKYDLAQYDNYSDVPDYSAVYADPEITGSDEQIAVVSSKTVSVMKYDLKVSDIKAAINVKNGAAVIMQADGKVASDTDKVISGMLLTLQDNSGNDYFANIMKDPIVLVLYDDLYGLEELEPLVVANASEKSVEGLTLPTTVMLYTGSQTLYTEVAWNVEGCAYNPRVSQEQKFTVAGTVALPNGVKNTMNIPLIVTVEVTVKEPSLPSVRVREGVTKVKVDRELYTIYYTQGMTAAELQKAIEPYGNTEYSITKYNSATGEVDIVKDTEKLDTLMGLDVRYKDTDYNLCYFIFEEMSTASSAPSGTGSENITPETGDNASVLVVYTLLAALFIVIFCRVKSRKEIV